MRKINIRNRHYKYNHRKPVEHTPQIDEALLQEFTEFISSKLANERKQEKETLSRLIESFTKASAAPVQSGFEERVVVSANIPEDVSSSDMRRMLPELIRGIALQIVDVIGENHRRKRDFS
jgi:hypothetical protein